jgi:hypothetical protein
LRASSAAPTPNAVLRTNRRLPIVICLSFNANRRR